MQPSQDQLVLLAQQIASTAPEEVDCEAVLDQVAAYLEAKNSDEDVSSRLELVAQHLEICPNCFEEFHALKTIFIPN